jgi:hypothetical protein
MLRYMMLIFDEFRGITAGSFRDYNLGTEYHFISRNKSVVGIILKRSLLY